MTAPEIDLTIPKFLDRKQWTQEQIWRNDDLWDIRIEEAKRRSVRAIQIDSRERELRRTEHAMNQAYGSLSRYFEGTTSYNMKKKQAEAYKLKKERLEKELAELRNQ